MYKNRHELDGILDIKEIVVAYWLMVTKQTHSPRAFLATSTNIFPANLLSRFFNLETSLTFFLQLGLEIPKVEKHCPRKQIYRWISHRKAL